MRVRGGGRLLVRYWLTADSRAGAAVRAAPSRDLVSCAGRPTCLQETHEVEPTPFMLPAPALRDHGGRLGQDRCEREHADRAVDQEAPVPGGVVGYGIRAVSGDLAVEAGHDAVSG